MRRILIDDLLEIPLDVKHLRERRKASGATGAAAYACTGQSSTADVTGDLLQAVQQRRLFVCRNSRKTALKACHKLCGYSTLLICSCSSARFIQTGHDRIRKVFLAEDVLDALDQPILQILQTVLQASGCKRDTGSTDPG